MLMRRSHARSKEDTRSKSFVCLLSGDSFTFLLRLYHIFSPLSLPTSPCCRILSFRPHFPSFFFLSQCRARATLIINPAPAHLRMCRRTCFARSGRVPRGWRQLKFSVQRPAPVLLAACVEHIKGSPRGWLMTRFPPSRVPLAGL